MSYDDMINLPHPEPQNHPRMSRWQRAAQFSPFAALVGYDAAIEETARLTEEEAELDADRITELDAILKALQSDIGSQPAAAVTYFCPDARKQGGLYKVKSGKLKKIDTVTGVLIFSDRSEIPIGRISQVERLDAPDPPSVF
ncbi:MAG: hypothetical protein Q3995_05455 [Eubacteriales bacterium]|nr:hypothetical protein [Eubacteriales bacterium]